MTLTYTLCSSGCKTIYVDVRYLRNYKAYNHYTLHSTSPRCTDLVTLTYISRSSDVDTFYVDVLLWLGCIIRKASAGDIATRENGTGREYMCPTGHIVYFFF